MSEEQQIVFWQNTLSIHQSALISALAERAQVTLVAEEDVYPERSDMGWFRPDFGKAKVVVAPGDAQLLEFARMSQAAHIFTGIGAYPMVSRAMASCAEAGGWMAMQSEPADWRGPLALARLARGRHYARRYGQTLSLALAIGHLARQWFRRIGLPESRTRPFAYFTQGPESGVDVEERDEVRLIVVASLVTRKGVDILLRALSDVPGPWFLTIVGDGPERNTLEKLALSRGLDEKVRFAGSLANDEAMRLLSQSDLLILPSRWDGWGAVVNEALMRGVPVVCSNRCGASDLIVSAELGAVYAWQSQSALSQELARRVAHGPAISSQRQRIRQWAECISGERAAQYVLDLIRSARDSSEAPRPPWRPFVD
ncbi:MAG: glycosyltransferase family 4 protein [Armatimonadetes bacterium]|nr:glycosyltransferase family 4 protein [Armatimonadota bacterium]